MVIRIEKVVTGDVVHYIVDSGQTHICHTLDEVFTLLVKSFGETPKKRPEAKD